MSSPRIKTRILALASLALLALASIMYTGCAKGITGDPYVNSLPLVRFVNVPPDSSTFSANPIVSWVGTDIDGRVEQFHYTVVKVGDVSPAATPGQPTPGEALAYAVGIPIEDWTILMVTLDDPANKDTVRMSADFTDPVNVIVRQFVFLRAIDDQGASSEIVYRTFGRNDHYPQTGLKPFVSPYVSVSQSRFGFGGVSAVWSGTDRIDFPSAELAPLEFEWRLYGPFTQAESLMIIDSFTLSILVTSERTYNIGETLIDTVFDFTLADTIIDSSSTPFDTQVSVHIDRIFDIPVELANEVELEEAGGKFDVIVDIGIIDALYNIKDDDRLVESSYNPLTDERWVIDRSANFFDVFRNDNVALGSEADTTREMSFLFWVVARDDAFVPDPTPAFSMLTVILPKHERDLLIVDYAKISFTANINGLYNSPCAFKFLTDNFEEGVDTAKVSFSRYVDKWKSGFVGGDNSFGFDTGTFVPCGDDFGAFPPGFLEKTNTTCDAPDYYSWNSSPDYMLGAAFGNFRPWRPTLRDILKHKVVILYKEHVQSPLPVKSGTIGEIWLIEGVLSGINYWTMSRAVFIPVKFNQDTATSYFVAKTAVPDVYSTIFGVLGGFWQGWYGMNVTRQADPLMARKPVRNEDFIGAVPIDEFASDYPELSIDTSRLRTKLRWSDPDVCEDARIAGRMKEYRYYDTIGALPEVGFAIPNNQAGTESIYLYRSRFGESKYPFYDLSFNDYQGTVVAVRRDAGFFRNSHWVFTPLVLEPTSFETSFGSMLDWLFAVPWGGPSFGGSARRTPASEELNYTSEANQLAQIREQRRLQQVNEIMGGQVYITNQFEYDVKYRQWKAEQRALEAADAATF
ncbi:hypothetical protein JYT16_00635 [Gemmatimonas aurantiaca]|nr:hypothetical protein [Gemmatimonas aurantiaca]